MTLALVIITIAFTFLAWRVPSINDRAILHPHSLAQGRHYDTLVTSGLIHADFWHLALNMFVLFSFGSVLQQYLTHFEQFAYLKPMAGRYAVIYFGAVVVANMATALQHRRNPGYFSLGASGGVSGVLLACALLDPWSLVSLYFFIKLPAILMAVLYIALSAYMSRRDGSGINHTAHLVGAVWGGLALMALHPGLVPLIGEALMKPEFNY